LYLSDVPPDLPSNVMRQSLKPLPNLRHSRRCSVEAKAESPLRRLILTHRMSVLNLGH
jgi:hypothetical protein